jgi:hypothetical protein
MDRWKPPLDHAISAEKAKELFVVPLPKRPFDFEHGWCADILVLPK